MKKIKINLTNAALKVTRVRELVISKLKDERGSDAIEKILIGLLVIGVIITIKAPVEAIATKAVALFETIILDKINVFK